MLEVRHMEDTLTGCVPVEFTRPGILPSFMCRNLKGLLVKVSGPFFVGGSIETSQEPTRTKERRNVRYREYMTMSRRQQLEPLITRIVKGASEEETSALKGYLEWMVAQVENREKVAVAA